MQTENGRYLYLFGEADFYHMGPDFYIWDLEEKTYEKHTFPLEEDWGFSSGIIRGPYTGPYIYDTIRNRIIARIESKVPEYRLVIINLDDLSLEYIPERDFPLTRYSYSFKYIPDLDILLKTEEDSNKIRTYNLTTGEVRLSNDFGYQVSTWSVMPGSSYPDLLANNKGPQICRFSPPARREYYVPMWKALVSDALLFPEGESALVVLKVPYEENYMTRIVEYFFGYDLLLNVELPFTFGQIYPDPKGKQLVGLRGEKMMFIKSGNNIRTFTPKRMKTSILGIELSMKIAVRSGIYTITSLLRKTFFFGFQLLKVV